MGKRPFIVSDKAMRGVYLGNKPFVTWRQADLIGQEYKNCLSRDVLADGDKIKRLADLMKSLFYKSYDTDLIRAMINCGYARSTQKVLKVFDEDNKPYLFESQYFSGGELHAFPVEDPLIPVVHQYKRPYRLEFPDLKWSWENAMKGGFLRAIKKDDPELIEALEIQKYLEEAPAHHLSHLNDRIPGNVAEIAMFFTNESDFLKEFPQAQEALENAKAHEDWVTALPDNEDAEVKQVMKAARRDIRRAISHLTKVWF